MKRKPKRITRTLASIVILVLLLGVFVAILTKIENSKYAARVENAYAQIERALASDPNYAMIEVSVETLSVPRGMLPIYRRALGRLPAVRRLAFLKTHRPTKGIELTGAANGFDTGLFYNEVISPLDIGDVPLQIKVAVSH